MPKREEADRVGFEEQPALVGVVVVAVAIHPER